MKFKVTKKEMRKNSYNLVSAGYCELQNLLYNDSPNAYSAGAYGWSCDYYIFDNVTICTGYSTIGKQLDYDLVRKFDNLASKIKSDCDISYEQKKEKLQSLKKEFFIAIKDQKSGNN